MLLYLAIFLSAIVVYYLANFFVSHKLTYKPTRLVNTSLGQEPKTVDCDVAWFKTADDQTLHGWYCTQPNSRGVLLICHGNKGCIAEKEDTLNFYLGLDLDVFIFDYRGYGHSTGRPSERGTQLDINAAWDYLRNTKKIKSDQIVLLGRSLGGAIAAQLAQYQQPAGVILESTFTSIKDIAVEIYPKLKYIFRPYVRYRTDLKVPLIKVPLLLVHSVEDELISFDHAQTLADCANPTPAIVQITGRHRDGFVTSRDTYLPAIRSFIDQNL